MAAPSEDDLPANRPPSGGGTRRDLFRRGALVAGALALGSLSLTEVAGGEDEIARSALRRAGRTSAQPNILVIVVDEMRSPRWFPAPATVDLLLPNIASLRRGAVSFERHFTASNDCTPARGTLLTGLHSHQTGCLVTGRSELEPGFPTWGTMLREHGYKTTWWGKWHLSTAPTLEPWGFSGGTFPSPNGGPFQGIHADPVIASQFEQWFGNAGGDGPWCTTVSFVNPHDIVWWWRWSDRSPGERSAPRYFSRLPGNFETRAELIARRKPRLQLALQDSTAVAFGEVPLSGRQARVRWCEQRDLYLKLQRDVDAQIGRVLHALRSRPEIERNTIVLFTSDHGEYGGSHGLRGKGAAVYDEGIQVPLYVKDPRGVLTKATNTPRRQLSSSVDVAPLLLTVAAGSNAWRSDPRYAHLARRADLAAICADPAAAGRPWIAHATDEVATEFCPSAYATSAPRHVIAVRTQAAKYALYTDWRAGTLEIARGNEDRELYEYSSAAGRLEVENRSGRSRHEEAMYRLLTDVVMPDELRAPMPSHLRDAQALGHGNYLQVADTVQSEVARATARRLARQRAQALGELGPRWRPGVFGPGGRGRP